MPLSVFSIGKSGGALQTLINTSSINALSSCSIDSDLTAGNSFRVDYKASPGYDFDPDTYEVSIT
jgi:hypothetical protein